jgi:O-antigen ligase
MTTHAFSRQQISAARVPGTLYATPVVPAPSRDSMAGVLGLRGMTLELWLTLAYIIVMGIGDLRAAKLGIYIGPAPIFLTDITLLLLFGVSLVRWPSRIVYWLSEGVGAGPVGRVVWILCILATVYFVLAFSEYGLYAVRDLAIFGYSLFFPLTCFAIRDRRDAVRLLRYLTYAGVVLALMLLFQIASGVNLGLFGKDTRFILGQTVSEMGSGDAGAFSVFSLAALFAYVIFERKLHRFHILCAIACFFALAATTSRSGVVGMSLASVVTFLCATRRYRLRYALFAGFLALLVFLSPLIPLTIPGAGLLQGLRLSVLSATGAASGVPPDPTSYFRLIRWRITFALWLKHPVFGVGFGRMLLPYTLPSIQGTERQGSFNMGMPHNTFLFLAARMGMVGLMSVLFCWLFILGRLFVVSRHTRRADELAATNILAMMLGFAMFVLFFERPMLNAVFWIVMAIGQRLIECQEVASASRPNARCALNLSRA